MEPSRILFVRNVGSSSPDDELAAMFRVGCPIFCDCPWDFLLLWECSLLPAAGKAEWCTLLLIFLQMFGDVRQLYTACKPRGFIMVTYFDLRSAIRAKNALHGTPAPGQAAQGLVMEIYYAVPKGDMTQNQVGKCEER